MRLLLRLKLSPLRKLLKPNARQMRPQERLVSNKRKNKWLILSNKWPKERLLSQAASPILGPAEHQVFLTSSLTWISMPAPKKRSLPNFSKTKL